MTGLILLLVFVAAIAALIVWFFLKKSDPRPAEEPEFENDTPSEADIHETYDPKPSGDGQEQPKDEQEKPKGDDKPGFDESQGTPLIDHAGHQPQQDPVVVLTDEMVEAFAGLVMVQKGTKTYAYLTDLIREADGQYRRTTSPHGLPMVFDKQNFPSVLDYYGKESDEDRAFRGLCGWLTALLLTELRPDLRNELLQAGYNFGPDKDVYIYRYEFRSDQNIIRLGGSVIYAAMRGLLKPDTQTMRSEVGGELVKHTLHGVAEGEFNDLEDYFVTIARFMPTAPGPYLKRYSDRSSVGGEPYPGAEKFDDGNLTPDSKIHKTIIEHYNLGGEEFHLRVVQAIADKEADVHHLFGDAVKTDHFAFRPVFGVDSIGRRLDPDGRLAAAARDIGIIASMARHPLLDGHQYGRRRPGQTENDGVAYDDPLGILVNYEIENNDGHPVGYYDREGIYSHGIDAEPEDFDYESRHEVYANSYPSGHSAYIWSIGLLLIELMPGLAHLIMRAANGYAVSRQITRFHYNSDTLMGRVIAAAMAPVIRATADYQQVLDAARDDLSGAQRLSGWE